jgi:hypothetical protein
MQDKRPPDNWPVPAGQWKPAGPAPAGFRYSQAEGILEGLEKADRYLQIIALKGL